MTPAVAWLRAQGIALPQGTEAVETGIVCLLIVAALVVGWATGRWLGPPAAALWRRRLGQYAEAFGPRIAIVIRYGVVALLLALLQASDAWPPLAAGLIGFFLGAATARALIDLLRGLGIPRWMAWAVAAFAFVALFSHAVGGLQPINDTLRAIGFDVGRTRLSLFSVAIALIVIVALLAGARLANRLIGHAIASSTGFDATQKLLAQKIAGIAVVALAFFIGIDLLDINLTSLAVFSGALGLAVGFGMQKTVGNLIAGIILLMDRSIKPGDVIVIEDKDVGWVNKIGVRAVSIITRDGKEHLIPNEDLMTKAVENWSYTDRNVRVRIPVGVAYDSDIALAQDLMVRAAAESPRVLANPKPNVWLTNFGDNGVEHEILVWINDPESGIGSVRSDVLNRLWVLFKTNGITVPFPQRDVRLITPPAP